MIVYYEKNIAYVESKHNRTCSSVFMHTKTPSVQESIYIRPGLSIQSLFTYICLLSLYPCTYFRIKICLNQVITAMRYRNDLIRSVLLLHIRANLGMMLARYYALCHADRSTLVMPVANTVQKDDLQNSGFISSRPLVGPFETHGSRTATATKSQGAHYYSELFVRCVRPFNNSIFINTLYQ